VRELERGIPPHRLVAVSAGDEVAVGGATVRAVPSAHEELRQDESGDYLALGFVVEIGGLRFYHSGDCVPYDGQPELLRAMAVDVALLPVNGRDAERSSNGVPGNFHWYEAVQLCRDAGIPSLLCHHWGMFSFNTVPPDDLRASLVAEAGDLSWVVPDLGVPYVYPGA
jgi:L-ascorbate metabolism protein UlaG (beta-lactamase superfamily)